MKTTIKGIAGALGITLSAGAAMMMLTLLIQVIMKAVAGDLTEHQLYNYSGVWGTLAAGVLTAAFVHKKVGDPYKTEGRTELSFKVLLIATVAVCICSVLWDSLIGLCLNRAFPIEASVSIKTTPFDYILSIAVAPISEELLFRKGLYGYSRNRIPKIAAVLFTSLLFALIHGYKLQGFLSALMAGVILTLIFEKTGNVWYSIITHMAFNVFSALSNALVHNGIEFYTEENGYVIYHWGVMLAAAVFAGCFAGIYLRNGRRKSVQDTCS